jgi:hypothetical protein
VLLALPFCGSGRPSIRGLIALLRTFKSLAVALMVVAGMAVAGIQPAQAAAPAQIWLNPTTGPVGSFATVSGTGFKASTVGTVVAGSTAFSFTTAAIGAFSTSITAETAGSSKAAWNTDLVSYLAAQPDVTGFVWFHMQKEADWRINSSASSASALSAALLARRS